MRYLRQFTRTNDRIYTKSLEKKEHDLLLAKKVLSTMTAISFIANPFGALAASVTNITDVNGKNLNGQGAVTDLYAQKMVDGNKTGVNQFKDFNLKANDIANMYFGKTKDAATASNLVNLVQNKIDISGTVNAIKNNKVGGNLFFLSSQGMAVTGSGVINAGSLTVLTPTADKMKNFTDLLAGSDTAATDTAMQGITNDGKWTAIPVNASGTISILGKVHTTDGINMRAAHINIGTSEDGKTVNKEALLKTGVTDFSDLVNITSNGSVVTNAGLGKNLTVSKTKTGDIVLSAIATERNAKDSIFDGSTTDNNMVHASVVNKGSVTAAGNVDISATASSGAEYEKYFTDEGGTTADELAVWGQIVKTKADVAIDGNVTGQHVDIAANSENSFISAGKIDADLGKINAAIGTVTVNMDGAYAVLGGEANVTIGKDAAVEATAADTVDTTGKVTEKALNISAQSTVKAGVGASTSAIKFANIKHSGVVPAAAAAYAKTTNTANVTVAGTVKSAGSAAVAADARTRLEAAAVDQTTQVGGNVNDTTAINAAIVIADGSNSSKVEFADTAKATEISGDLDIGAASINSVDTQALVKGKESSIAATAVNVTNYAGTADVKIDTALKASDVSIHAANTMLDNHVIADNAVGSSAIMTKVVNHASGSLSAGTVKGFIGKLKDKIMPPSGDTTAEFWNDIGQKLSLGASVAVADETNGAHVTLTKNAQITADGSAGKKGDISIAANNTIADTQMQATGATSH